MKKVLYLFFAMLAISFSSLAEESTGNKSHTVGLEFDYLSDNSSTVHRAPMRINIDAYYDARTNTVEISYNGEEDGEVFLYLNDNIIDYDCQINTTLQLPTSTGSYGIKIVTESWVASGYIKL